MNTQIRVNREKKKPELYPWTLILLLCGLHPSFMPALMLIRSSTKLIKLINSTVSSSQPGDSAGLAQWWENKEMRETRLWEQEEESRNTSFSSSNLLDCSAATWNHSLWVQSDYQFNLSACCLPKEIVWPLFCPPLSLVATEIGVVMQQNLLFLRLDDWHL